jgi:predicted mannosyl-3-phosphoglycerate phosphatase (HAD superfamily)
MTNIVKNEYSVSLERFDEDLDATHGASYHGYNIIINNNDVQYIAKKYDEDDYFFLLEEGLSKILVSDIFNSVKEKLDVKGYKTFDGVVVYPK